MKFKNNEIAIITGAGRGIGAATAELFASQGARVVMVSRTRNELMQTAREIGKRWGQDRVLAIPADVSQENEVEGVFAKSLQKFGPLDILVNNAAVLEVEDFIDLKTQNWDQTMAVNLRGPFLCSRAAFQQMRAAKKQGTVINIGSLSGIRGTEKFKGFCPYIVSKHGMIGLTESLAVEGKEYNIRVHCIAPGAVETSMLKKAAPFLKTRTTPVDIAKIILFLCDDQQ